MGFRAELTLHGRTATGISVPEDVVLGLDAGRRPPVTVTLNGYRYRTTIAPRGGAYLVPVSAEIRTAAGVAAGDIIDVDIVLDPEPRTIAAPDDLTAALAEAPAAQTFFASLSISNQRGYVDWIEQAKKPETRDVRVAKAVELLAAGQARR